MQPADADVFVDGRRRATGSTTLQLSSAPRNIEVRRAGYQTWTRTVTPRPGYPQTVTARLRSLAYLVDAMVDYAEDRMGGQLTIKAPNARVPRVGPDAPLEETRVSPEYWL